MKVVLYPAAGVFQIYLAVGARSTVGFVLFTLAGVLLFIIATGYAIQLWGGG